MSDLQEQCVLFISALFNNLVLQLKYNFDRIMKHFYTIYISIEIHDMMNFQPGIKKGILTI